MALPLAGVKVLDLTRALAGPFCTMILADLGAEVIKVEPTGGEMIRGWGPFKEGISVYYLSVHRNKRSLVVNFRDPAGLELLREMIRDVDVVIMLRVQNERMRGALLPSSNEYFKHYGLTAEKLALAKPDAIVMHPGPMNRGVEIDSAVADGSQSVILNQVTFGIAVRMAVMSIVAGASA